MNYKIYISIVLCLFLVSCQENEYKPKGLTMVTEAELIEGAKNKKFPGLENATLKNHQGEILQLDTIYKITNNEDWTFDMYADSNGDVKELVLRKATSEDKQFRQKLKEAFKYQPQIALVDVDCAKKSEILQKVFESDQAMRTNGGEIDPNIDAQNLGTVISLIEKCGMPTLEEVDEIQMAAIWVVFQHGNNESRKKYLPLLEQAAKKGDLKAAHIVMMKDRTLMEDGEPQVYGTQVTKDGGEWILYELENPKSVNKRRAEMGLEPLQEYLKRWNIKFDIKQVD